jgi:hypothetical protein
LSLKNSVSTSIQLVIPFFIWISLELIEKKHKIKFTVQHIIAELWFWKVSFKRGYKLRLKIKWINKSVEIFYYSVVKTSKGFNFIEAD